MDIKTNIDVRKNLEFDESTGTILYYKGNANDVLVIPETINGVKVKHIGDYAFCKSRKLCVILLPESIETIGTGAFYECTALLSINIPGKVKEIKSKTFYNNANLEYVNLKNDQVDIAKDAFKGCINLKE